ncbi:MAG TPA: ATP-dependent Clp protease ATP-binding subunit, partial [Saprospiraceae bacterium]|nr:ATP-dependent Clp protease ATP-binding subunit [Saprospiraceae bacterium]
ARQLKEFGTGVGFATKARQESEEDDSKAVITSALKKTFSPEFLNRIDDVIVFNSLSQPDIFKIIDISIKELLNRLSHLEYSLELDEKTKEFLSEKGYDPQFGARPLHRAIQKYIEDPLAEFILGENPAPGSVFLASVDESGEKLIISMKKTSKSDVK